jgi:soluble lytic murein transglycosylase
MRMRKCWGRNIRGRWFSAAGCAAALLIGAQAHAAAPALATLVKAYRLAPTAGKRAAIETYAAGHPKEAPQARLALGMAAYEQKDYAAAIANLRQAVGKLPKVDDYAAYYLAAARVEANDFAGIPKGLETVHNMMPRSPLAGKAWVVEARALEASDAAGAVKALRDHYAELPQPDGDVTLADCYQAAGDLRNAADFYQRVYYEYLTGDAATHAAAALVALKDAMGSAYPEPLPEQKLRRADRLMDAHLYAQAQAEYGAIGGPPELASEQAKVRAGAADYQAGNAQRAYAYLAGLDLPESDADAERLYYMEESARRQANDAQMMAAVDGLGTKHQKSPWRLKALVSAANRYLLVNRPDDFVPLYSAAYADFPDSPAAALCHWKVAFQAYLRGKPEAVGLLREQLKNYPAHTSAAAALYFMGRLAEQAGDPGSAKVYYQRLAIAFENYYYAVLARQRLTIPEIAAAPPTQQAAEFSSTLVFPQAQPPATAPTASTTARIERSRVLRQAGLNDVADGELRFGARTDAQPALIAMEMADAADSAFQGLRAMKSLVPDYLGLSLGSAPRSFWTLLFPLPYRTDLQAAAVAQGLDPYLVAGLIRQESEFNPAAVSHANAYGLTQLRPATARQYARRAGVRRPSTQALLQPAVNLKIGATYLRSMLDQHSGRVEETLASYNAGPNRAAEWLNWNHYREPAEFVESIPFSETRDYVQAVLRNADIYRRLYLVR